MQPGSQLTKDRFPVRFPQSQLSSYQPQATCRCLLCKIVTHPGHFFLHVSNEAFKVMQRDGLVTAEVQLFSGSCEKKQNFNRLKFKMSKGFEWVHSGLLWRHPSAMTFRLGLDLFRIRQIRQPWTQSETSCRVPKTHCSDKDCALWSLQGAKSKFAL